MYHGTVFFFDDVAAVSLEPPAAVGIGTTAGAMGTDGGFHQKSGAERKR